jgi:hypothetical protein
MALPSVSLGFAHCKSVLVRQSALLRAPVFADGAHILWASRACEGAEPTIGKKDTEQADHGTQEETHLQNLFTVRARQRQSVTAEVKGTA